MNEELLLAKLNMIADQIKHEDNLVGDRMSWLVISQSFLFGTYATLVGWKGLVGEAASAVRLLLRLIPVVGMLLPVLVLVAMGAATYAIKQWRNERTRIFEMPEAKQLDWPRLKNWKLVTVLGQLLPIIASFGFIIAWVTLLLKI